MRRKIRDWISPIVYLSNNWISLTGVVLVTGAAVIWILLLPTMLRGDAATPYIGILTFLILPVIFFTGLGLIPLGIWLRSKREHTSGIYPTAFPPVDMRNQAFRRLLTFVALATFANIIIGSQLTYRAVHYMDSVTFCGQACHTVMQPEFAAYQNSPHARVACVDCHIGPGASWFVRSKLSGAGQLLAVTFNTYPRPIPTPIENLRPARETCEQCHWPDKVSADRLRVIPTYAEEEANTESKTVLLMHIGGGPQVRGIHGVHLGPGVTIRYAHSDDKRLEIPWVEYNDGKGNTTQYASPDFKPGTENTMRVRVMDCLDCHNRPTHVFELPETAVNHAMASGEISPALPYAKKKSLELLKVSYNNHDDAQQRITQEFAAYYREQHPEIFEKQPIEVKRAASAVWNIYSRNVFPEMKVTWGTYPNHIGHTDFPGCFRCHDDNHPTASGKNLTQDCSACHNLLAMDEENPEILKTLGAR
ncbi:MAG: NapC/NirT family cytochrome c [Bryobacteraceae bacterium]|nr:NapC/NirT family cytochrome c [Bryobacteraceae bacterium]